MFKNANKQRFEGPAGRIYIFLLILIVVVIVAAVGIYFAYEQEQKMQEIVDVSGNKPQAIIDSSNSDVSGMALSTTSAAIADPVRLQAEKAGRPALGNPSAGLVIVEFADFECPVCHEEFYQIREFVNRHQDEVYYIYRHYPIIGDNSAYLARASMCAYDQGKFWPLHDKLFLNQGQIESEEAFTNIARQSGVDIAKFSQCMQSDKYGSLIFEDMNDAVNLNVAGTPTFFVNGNKLEGVISLADWEKILEKYKQTNNK